MRVLVGGGTGFVGKHLKSLLTSKGHDVINISRKAAPGVITWDELEKNGFPENTEAVVNLSGENIMGYFTKFDDTFKAKIRDSRIVPTKQLADLIIKSDKPPKVFVSSSAVGYYKPSLTAEYTEDSPPGDDFFAKLCVDWEAAAKLPEGVDCRHVCVRIGVACGRDGGMIQRIFWPFWMGLGGKLGSGNQWLPWVHVDDVAGIFAHAIENDHVTGALNAVAPIPTTNQDFMHQFATTLCRPGFIPMPAFALNMMLGSERATMLLEGQKVVPNRTSVSGYRFKYRNLKKAMDEWSRIF